MEHRFAKMRQIVCKSTHREILSESKDQEMEERYEELQSQLTKYKEKEKTLLRIVESLSAPKSGHRWK
jgi:hypothetical protein